MTTVSGRKPRGGAPMSPDIASEEKTNSAINSHMHRILAQPMTKATKNQINPTPIDLIAMLGSSLKQSPPPWIASQTFHKTFEDSSSNRPLRTIISQGDISYTYAEKREIGELLISAIAEFNQLTPSRLEPLVYRSLNIVEGHPNDGLRVQSAKFCTAFRTAPKSRDFYALNVRSIYIDDLGLRSIGERFLPMCTSMVELAYASSNYPPRPDILKKIMETSHFPRLRRLGIDGAAQSLGLLSEFNIPILQQITLIELVDSGNMRWDGLKDLRGLRHLLIDVRPQWKDLDRFSARAADHLIPIVKALLPHLPLDLQHAVFLLPSYLPFLLSWIDVERQARQNRPPSFRPVIQGQVDRRVFLGVPNNAEELNAAGTTESHLNEFQNTIQHIVCVNRANPPWYWVRWAERVVDDSEFRRCPYAALDFRAVRDLTSSFS